MGFEKCDSLKKYEDNLGCCIKNFKTILPEHKQAYVNWKLSSSADDSAFKKTNTNLDKNLNSYIQKIKLNLEEAFKQNQKLLEKKKNILKDMKIKLKVVENLYKGANDIDNASGPLENNLSKEILHDYAYTTFLFFGIAFSSTFLIKNFYK
jgi:hypothetical protein